MLEASANGCVLVAPNKLSYKSLSKVYKNVFDTYEEAKEMVISFICGEREMDLVDLLEFDPQNIVYKMFKK